jgi:hypothetical protein
MTGLPEPPFQTIAARTHHRVPGMHGKLADPRWITANLAYLRDLDSFEERTKKTHGPSHPSPKTPGPPGPGKGQPKGKPKGEQTAAE